MSTITEEEVLCVCETEYEDDCHFGPGCLVGIAIIAVPWAMTAAFVWWVLNR